MRTMQWMRFLGAWFALSAMAGEIPVSEDAVIGAAPGRQYAADVASNGSEYLVVWGDDRAGVSQTYGTRVSRDGTVLDPNGFRVAAGDLNIAHYGTDEHRSHVRTIWSGQSWFVLSNVCARGFELVRVDRDGRVLDSFPQFLGGGSTCSNFSLASDGRHVVLGYQRGVGHLDYPEVLFLDSDGEPLSVVRLSPDAQQYSMPLVTASQSSFVAVWETRAVRFDHRGIIDSRPLAFGERRAAIAIASDGTNMLVVRGDRAFRLSADLTLEPLGILPFTDVTSVVWTGSAYVVSGAIVSRQTNWTQREIVILQLDSGGGLLAQNAVRSGRGGETGGKYAATNGENVLLAWNDPPEPPWGPATDFNVFLSVVSLPELTPAPPKLLSVSAEAQLRPATASSGNHLLTVWKETAGIYARRSWRDGRADGPPIRLTTDATSMDVAFNGTDFVVATTEGNAVITRLLPATGELTLDRTSRLEGHTPGAIAIADRGGVTMAAWIDHGVRAAVVAADGTLPVVPLEVASVPETSDALEIAISASDTGHFLVAWGGSTPQCVCSPPVVPSRSSTLRAARVTSRLTLLDRLPIDLAIPVSADDPRADAASSHYDAAHSLKADRPSAAWNGKEWLVVWNRGFRTAHGEAREEIRGRRIASNGTLLDGSANDPGVHIVSDGVSPTIAWTGSRYLLAWYAAMPVYSGGALQRSHRICTALLENPGGALLTGRTLGESPARDAISIAVANGVSVLTYSRLGEDHLYGGVPRAYFDITLDPAGPRRRAVRR